MPDLEPITREEMLWSGEDIEPITREEMYIKHIFDKTQTIPSKPLTRKEMLLEKAGEGGGSDVTIKQLSVTENGTYSKENTAYSPVIVNVPAPPIPDNAYLLNEVEDLPKDIATFTDGSNLPMPKLKVGIEPIQDLHGYDAPWPAGGGKNKCPINSGTITVGDFVTFSTPLPSGTYSISLKATRTPSITSYASLVPYDKDGVAYPVIGIVPDKLDGSVIKSEARDFNNGLSKIYVYSIAGSWSDSRNYTLTISDLQIEQGSTASDFAPYENDCPIIGWTEANVTVADDVDNPTVTHTTTIPFVDSQGNPIEVFGGSCDVVNGTSGNENNLVSAQLNNSTTYTITGKARLTNYWVASITNIPNVSENIKTFSTCYCSVSPKDMAYNLATVSGFAKNLASPYPIFVIMDSDSGLDATATNEQVQTAINDWIHTNTPQIVYELATPSTFYTQPTSIKSLEGVNNISANTGKIINGQYFSKGGIS